jgi:antitoxin (DNA-binding transcriptional repressor) of toxin-antitoxin stability system
VIKEQTFIANMLRRDNSEIEQFRNIIEDNPALLNEWKTGLAQSWKRAAFNEKERYSPDLSKKWFEDNNGALEYFFTGAEIKAMQSTGGLAKKVASQTERLKKFVDKANKKWGSGSLSRVDPEGLTKFITGGGGGWTTPIGKGVQTRISKIKYVKNITAEHPSAWRGLQNDFKANIRNTIIDPQTGNLNAGKLADMVGDSDHVKVIKEMLGTKYYEDLKVISEALSIVSKSEIRMAGSQGMKASIQAVRAGAAPPLTKRGRVLTTLVTFNNKSAQKRAADALLSNTSMRETAELLSHDPWTRRFMEKSFSLGYGMPGEDE